MALGTRRRGLDVLIEQMNGMWRPGMLSEEVRQCAQSLTSNSEMIDELVSYFVDDRQDRYEADQRYATWKYD